MKTRKDIIPIVSAMYLTADENLEHRYSVRDIRDTVRNNFTVRITEKSILKIIQTPAADGKTLSQQWKEMIIRQVANTETIRAGEAIRESFVKMGKVAVGKLAKNLKDNQVDVKGLITLAKAGAELDKRTGGVAEIAELLKMIGTEMGDEG